MTSFVKEGYNLLLSRAKKNFILNCYEKHRVMFFKMNQIESSTKNLWQFHCYHLLWVTCVPISWFYTYFAFNQSTSILLKLTAVLSSIVSFLLPLILKLSKSMKISTYICTVVNFLFHSVGVLYSGGIYSSLLGWNVIFPLVLGLLLGPKHLIRGSIIIFLIDILFYLLFRVGIHFDGGFQFTTLHQMHLGFLFGWLIMNVLLTYSFLAFRDRVHQRLEEKKQQVEILVRLLCHDLNVPITIVDMCLKNIENEVIEKNKLTLTKAKEALRQMSNIVSNVQVMQLNRDDGFSIPVENICVVEATKSTIDLFDQELKNKKITINLRFSSENLMILANKQVLISQILSNFISNAIKFSYPQSEIEVQINKNDENITIFFADSGIGMSQEIIRYLFDNISNKSRLGTNGEVGTGFGMMIAKSFIEKFGGTLAINPKQDGNTVGTVVKISFPSVK